MADERVLELGEKVPFRWEHGPVSFGWVLATAVVSWSDHASRDLLTSRCWDGVYLYPSKTLADEDLSRDPIKVCPSFACPTMAWPVDWNRDGKGDLLVADRLGFLYLLERQGEFPNIRFEPAEPIRDVETDLVLNIPYENPNHSQLNDLGGYIEPHFFNYAYPAVYPSGDGGTDLIVGDMAGSLWWLPDVSDRKGKPRYTGIRYDKPSYSKSYAKDYLGKYGTQYVRPAERICDERGVPHLLGAFRDTGVSFEGGNVRPIVFPNPQTGSNDLLVMVNGWGLPQALRYLRRVGSSRGSKPAFEDLGEVPIEGVGPRDFQGHSYPAVCERDGRSDLLIPCGCHITVLRNKRLQEPVPQFEFSRFISAKDALAPGYNFTEILTDDRGRRYFLENTSDWKLREVTRHDGGIRLSPASIRLQDQNGPFWVEGETDPYESPEWGFHRAARWDFDKSGRQHLIVGTDKGLLYLLIDDPGLDRDGAFRFRSVGPLKDREGTVIRVHNRVCAGGIDLNGDGLEDLVLGGVTYQLGTETDPSPGGGVYYAIHQGLDDDGLPILDVVKPLEIEGWAFHIPVNTHVQIQTIDLDRDGEKEVIIAVQEDNCKGHVFKPLRDRVGLRHTGQALPSLSCDERILDVDGDGELEHLFSGGEVGVGYYQKIRF